MNRKLTQTESARFKRSFPNLNTQKAVVTDNATSRYNCIAWTVGSTSSWIWPGSSLADFDLFYAQKGFQRSSNGPIAVWATSGSMTHGCISGVGHGPRWESKCGSDLRIQHGLSELRGSTYGRVVAFYRMSGTASATPTPPTSQEGDDMDREHLDELLHEAVSTVNEAVAEEFESRFNAWKETWNAEHTLHLSNPAFVTYSREYCDLVAMGPEILPLIVLKLTDPENFFALQLYEAVESDPGALVDINPAEDTIMEGEQGRARQTVERWVSNL